MTDLRTEKKVFLGGAGGAPTNNVIRSLRESGSEYLIGSSSLPTDLFLASVDQKIVAPAANDNGYENYLRNIIKETQPDFVHFQNDFEIRKASSLRNIFDEYHVKYFLPDHTVIENCVDKFASYRLWKTAGLKVPETVLVNNENDLEHAFNQFGGKIWLRATEGGGGRGALPTEDLAFAKLWVKRFNGWGSFTVAECLTDRSVTWLSIWYEGELIVAQTRLRHSWNFGNRTLSGVTGITGVAQTWSDEATTAISMNAINTIDPQPHGIYGVDLTFDSSGVPNPTEINIARFFTTVYFFTKAGLNLPRIYLDIGLYGKLPQLSRKINPLPDGLVWIRGMDIEPVLTTIDALNQLSNS
jgi:hypothetical protein